jgi:hypothetical protein
MLALSFVGSLWSSLQQPLPGIITDWYSRRTVAQY